MSDWFFSNTAAGRWHACSAVLASAARAPSSRSVRSCRSPYTCSVVSDTVASTPPMPVPSTVSSGTGLYATTKCVSSRNPRRLISRSRSSLHVAGSPRNGASIIGPMTCQISAQHSAVGWPIDRGCLSPSTGR